MKTHDIVIFWLIGAITLFGVMSFFIEPKFQEGSKLIIECLIGSLAIVFTYKFTAHVPSPPPGTEQATLTKTPPVAAPVEPEKDTNV